MSTQFLSKKRILISTGEASGDLHASYLIKEIEKLAPTYSFFGMGGAKLKAAGADIRIDSSRKGVVGLLEALPYLGSFFFSFKKMARFLKAEKPDLLFLLDSQGFNLPLAKEARKLGIKTVYYICPQEWLWGTPKGAKAVVRGIDNLFCIFRKEFDVYAAAGGNVYYKGHPLLDIVKPRLTREESYKVLELDPGLPIISVFAGNRQHEIKKLLPLFLGAANIIKRRLPGAQFIFPLFNAAYQKEVEKALKKHAVRAKVVLGYNYEALSISTLALSSPGTITIEAVISACPIIAAYKLSPLTYFFGKHVLKIKLRHFCMPNILVDKKVIPEFIQKEAVPEKVAAEAIRLLQDEAARNSLLNGYQEIRETLGLPGTLRYLAKVFVGIVERSF